MEIHIFYRHYNISGNDNKNRPSWFSFESCFNNLFNTIKDYNSVKLHVVMDGDINSNWINKYKEYYSTHEFKGGSDQASANFTYNLIQTMINKGEIKPDDLIYLTENDYLHCYDWVKIVYDLFESYTGLHYVSLYDHNDKYFLPIYDDLVSKIFPTQYKHWRTTPSTCGSYVVRCDTLIEDLKDHINVIGDHNKWLHLNQTKHRFILTPIPGLSTHCMEGLLSPTIDWKQINNLKT